MSTTIPVTLRTATQADAPALHTLAALDSAAPLRGQVLLAEVDEEPVAARSLTDGRAVADPFRHTAELLAMLELRAAQLEHAEGRAGAAERLRSALAPLTEALRGPWGRESFSRR